LLTKPVQRNLYETVTEVVQATGAATSYGFCQAANNFGPDSANGQNVLVMYDSRSQGPKRIYPVFSFEDCCAACVKAGGCAAGVWDYGHNCFIFGTTGLTCDAQASYEMDFVESYDNLYDAHIFNGPCGYTTWDGQVLDSSGAMEKRQVSGHGSLSPALGEGTEYSTND
jgi:hypothetical protein